MVHIPNYFSFHTWLKHVMVKCTVCGETRNFQTNTGNVHLLSEITCWADDHWNAKHAIKDGDGNGNGDTRSHGD